MTLALVRTEPVPVEKLQPGDTLVLPSQREVTLEYVEEFDGLFFARWHRPRSSDEPGHDGRLLGSLIGVPKGHCWTVKR